MSFVRVRLPNGYEASVSEGHAATEGLEVLDEPATNLRGKPLPVTRKNGRPVMPRTTVAAKAAAKKAAAPQGRPGVKTCCVCGESKTRSEFGTERKKRDGLASRCRPCAAAYLREWKRLNHERKLELNRRWSKGNATYYREWRRAWRAANPEANREADQRWRDANPDKVRTKDMRRRAAKRGHRFGLR